MDSSTRTRIGHGRRWKTWGAMLLVATTGAVMGTVGQADAITAVTAMYEMNEAPGATVLVDSGPNALNGTIGSLVTAGAEFDGATGLRFTAQCPVCIPADNQRLALVNTNDALNPGSGDFAIEFRYRTTKSFGNVVQKGQNGSVGGYFKFEQPSGFMTCLFKGANGVQRAAKSPFSTRDGQWHTIRCERTTREVRLFIDGVRVAKTNASGMGNIANTRPLSIGGKQNCDQVATSCDYFNGDIDYVKIEKQPAA